MSKLNPSQKLLLLLERPSDPVFSPKGITKKYIVDVPDEYVAEELRPLRQQEGGPGSRIKQKPAGDIRFEEVPAPERLAVGNVTLPDMAPVYVVPRGVQWSVFYDQHKQAANTLIRYMLKFTPDELFNFSSIVRDNVNEQMFVYALMSTLIRRPDLRQSVQDLGNIFEYFPDKFMQVQKLKEVENKDKLASKTQNTEKLIIDHTFTATDKDPENRLAYFREDLGINSHHWHWHLVYPDDGTVKTDRRGELFYYMHHQVLARYDAERISNGLPVVKPFHRFEEPIPEAYFGKLTTSNSGQVWGSRPAGLRLQDIELPERDSFTIQDLETWRDRIRLAIHLGSAKSTDGKDILLDENTGIDILGNMVEPASEFSINRRFYGSFHNKGHLAFGHVHDPTGAHKENGGPMVDTLTAMRDPIFYRWHKHVDNLFGEFKQTLKPYTVAELSFPGLIMSECRLTSGTTQGQIKTAWAKSSLSLAQGLDLQGTNEILAEVKHLTHESFKYDFKVVNRNTSVQRVCFRVFLAPQFDETGVQLTFREQKNMMVEMDKFAKDVPPGTSAVTRSSEESSVTIPSERFFRVYGKVGRNLGNLMTEFERFCGCGWPQHMLVPKGNKEGMKFMLVVMATNWAKDEVPVKTSKPCSNGTAYCGVLDEKYPDKRALGYPFDRPLASRDTTYDEFKQGLTNITRTDITIRFKDEIV